MQAVDLILNRQSLPQYIDHTLLRPDATETELSRVCQEAREYGFKTVCVEAKWLPLVVRLLHGSKVLPIAVIDFPLGEKTTELKCDEARAALKAGAQELDMVLNRNLLKAKNYSAVFADILGVVQTAAGVPVKVILETSELNDQEKIVACALAKAAGARFVKTSTGFSRAGATESDIALMRSVVGPDCGVKASGGVRSLADVIRMVHAGADRIGASASVAIIKGLETSPGSY